MPPLRLHLNPSKYPFARAFEEFVRSHVRPGKRVLDLASKDFRMAHYFNGLKYVGADIDQAALDAGKRKYSGGDHVAVHCDLLAPPFGDEEFDYVVSTHTLVHLPDDSARAQAIEHLIRMTKCGGRVFFNLRITPVMEAEADRIMARACGAFEKIAYRRSLCAAYHNRITVRVRRKRPAVVRLARVGSLFVHLLDRFGPPTEAIYSGRRRT
jgi:ubiquinone/menaquinone biosynthesis C-methylase UbiE